MKDRYVIRIHLPERQDIEELEVPADITVLDLIGALSDIYHLPVNRHRIFEYYLKMNFPRALLRGETVLKDTGMRDGSEVWIWNES